MFFFRLVRTTGEAVESLRIRRKSEVGNCGGDAKTRSGGIGLATGKETGKEKTATFSQ